MALAMSDHGLKEPAEATKDKVWAVISGSARSSSLATNRCMASLVLWAVNAPSSEYSSYIQTDPSAAFAFALYPSVPGSASVWCTIHRTRSSNSSNRPGFAVNFASTTTLATECESTSAVTGFGRPPEHDVVRR